jgi:hypothetical protein
MKPEPIQQSLVLFEQCIRKEIYKRWQTLTCFFCNTIMCGRILRQKIRNMWVHPTNMKRLEFGIYEHSPSPVQLVSKHSLSSLSFYVHNDRHRSLTGGPDLKESIFLHSFPNAKYQTSRPISGVRLTNMKHAVSRLLLFKTGGSRLLCSHSHMRPLQACQLASATSERNGLLLLLEGKGKGKVHPRTGHEGPEGGVEV